MRRSISTVMVTLGALCTPLSGDLRAQVTPRNAIGFGFAATLGTEWQIEGGEVAYVHRRAGGLVGALSAGIRVGTFIDEGAILGGSRGLVAAGTFAVRTGTASLTQLGEEIDPTSIGFDVTLEGSGYIASNSPLEHGSQWGAVALLPGLRAGSGDGLRYGLVIGPTAFIGGGRTTVRGLLGFRLEAPLARRERRP